MFIKCDLFVILVLSVIEKTVIGGKMVDEFNLRLQREEENWIWGYVHSDNSDDDKKFWGYLDKDENKPFTEKNTPKPKIKVEQCTNKYASGYDLPMPSFYKQWKTKTESNSNTQNNIQLPSMMQFQLDNHFGKIYPSQFDASSLKKPPVLIDIKPFRLNISSTPRTEIYKKLLHNSSISYIPIIDNDSTRRQSVSLHRLFGPQRFNTISILDSKLQASSTVPTAASTTYRLQFEQIFAEMSVLSSIPPSKKKHKKKPKTSTSTTTQSPEFIASDKTPSLPPMLSHSVASSSNTLTSGVLPFFLGISTSSLNNVTNDLTTPQTESFSMPHVYFNKSLSSNKERSFYSDIISSIFFTPPASEANSSNNSAFPNNDTKSHTQSQNASVKMPSSINKNQSLQEKNDEKYPCDQPIATMPNFTAPGRRTSEEKCYEYIWQIKAREEMAKNEKDCIKYNRDRHIVTFHIEAVGGREALPGEFPHMGAVGWKAVAGTWIFRCGSSLISSMFAITAAHCTRASSTDSAIFDPVPKLIRFGDKNVIDEYSHGMFPNDAYIRNIIIHPGYKSPMRYNDVALMKLEQNIDFNHNVQPACLWKYFDTETLGKKAIITGWGVVNSAASITSPSLEIAEVELIDSMTCDSILKPFCHQNWCGVQDTQMCAGNITGGDVNACQGDSGGPLQVKIPLPITSEGAIHYLIGIISLGFRCTERNIPVVYTKISPYLDWIESIVWPETS